jgi:DMSO/TMAO reductase YedYZ molybdopterin-dependent catalytic subunit
MQLIPSSAVIPTNQPSSSHRPAVPNHAILAEDGFTPVNTFFANSHRFVPQIDASLWQLVVNGLGIKPLRLTLSDLVGVSYQQVECTLCNRLTDRDLPIGHARWGGVPLKRILALTEVENRYPGVRFYGADGYQVSLPTEHLTDAVLVTEMNGQPLTSVHGFPLRLIVPGLTESAMPKWLQRIELLDTSVSQPLYRVPTSAALLYPPHHATLTGEVQLAGIAYAGNRAIDLIEVSIDDTAWMPVVFERPMSPTIWTRWQTLWIPPSPGHYPVSVRAADSEGVWSAIHRTVIHICAAQS